MQSLKIVVVGDGAAGKTSLLMSMSGNDVQHMEYTPTVFDNSSINLMVDERPYNVGLWDTAGAEDYARLRPLSYPQTDVFLICCAQGSTTNLDTLRHTWLPELRHHAPGVPILIVETKNDLSEEGLGDLVEIAREEKVAGIASTSAYFNEGVTPCLEHAVRLGTWYQMQKNSSPTRNSFLARNIWFKAARDFLLRIRRSRETRELLPPPFFVGEGIESKPSKTFACCICFEDGLKYREITQCFSKCDHRICRKCAKSYITNEVESGKIHITCPFVEPERCTAVLKENFIKRLCGDHMLNLYNKSLYSTHWNYVEQLQTEAAKGKEVDFVTWAHDNTRNCPRCSVIIYRFAGCDHMSCKCGMSFNWSQAPKLGLPPSVQKERENQKSQNLSASPAIADAVGAAV